MPDLQDREERLDPEERAQQQLERLQSTLNRAFKNVPFYRNQFGKWRVDPTRIESILDLQHIPFTDRAHFSENYPYGLFAVPLRDVVRIHTAPGPGLRPVVSGYTRQDLNVWKNLVSRALSAAGMSSNDILQIELDQGLANWGRDYKDGAESLEASVIPLTSLPPEKQLMVLKDYRTSVLVASPSAAGQLVHHLFRANINPNELSLKTLVLVGQPPDAKTIRDLESELHVKAWAHYGLSEVPGPAIAFECEAGSGLHISEDHFLPEVIDPASGAVLPEGREGELVLTTLTTRAFPLIRFRTGDRVKLTREECACGRTLIRMEWLPDRTDDLAVVRGVKVHYHQLLLLLERSLGHIPDAYRFAIHRHRMDEHLEVWLKVDGLIFSDEVKEIESLSRRVAAELSQELGVDVRIRLKEADSFRPEAKSYRIEVIQTND